MVEALHDLVDAVLGVHTLVSKHSAAAPRSGDPLLLWDSGVHGS